MPSYPFLGLFDLDKFEFREFNKHRSQPGSSSPWLCRYIGLTILYNNKVYSKHTFLELAKEPAVLEAIASRLNQHVVWDGVPAPFCKLVLCSDEQTTYHVLNTMSKQEVAILAQYLSMMDSFSLRNIKLYHNYFSELINRKKKDMFGLREWRQQIYIHLIPLRDLGEQDVKMLVCGDIVPTYLESFKPLLYPFYDYKVNKVKHVTRDLWSAHPNYRIRDVRFGSYTTKIDKIETDVYYSFYTGAPVKRAFDVMLNCQSGECDQLDSQSAEEAELRYIDEFCMKHDIPNKGTILYDQRLFTKESFMVLFRSYLVCVNQVEQRVLNMEFNDKLFAPFDRMKIYKCYHLERFNSITFSDFLGNFSDDEIAQLFEFCTLFDSINSRNVVRYSKMSNLMDCTPLDIPLRDLLTGKIFSIDPMKQFHELRNFIFMPFMRRGGYTAEFMSSLGHTSSTLGMYTTCEVIGNPFCIECQSGECDPNESLPTEEEENPDSKKAEIQTASKLPPSGYGNVYAKQETATSSIFSINSQVSTAKQPTKWESNKKLKDQATEFFG